jgi:hypothetical protein
MRSIYNFFAHDTTRCVETLKRKLSNPTYDAIQPKNKNQEQKLDQKSRPDKSPNPSFGNSHKNKLLVHDNEAFDTNKHGQEYTKTIHTNDI